ncbi:MAG: hypothetical protein SFY81_00960 [Verrucomicrobiota bacterium]|nr:hypothetical protein [Verrucomicrobiota bacterium]
MLLLLSVVTNIVLATMVLMISRTGEELPQPPAKAALSRKIFRSSAPSVVIRRQFFHWNEIESRDFPTYINNLRGIGCPESTIRDIIVAEVDELFAGRRRREIVTGESQWWRSDPSLDVIEQAATQIAALEAERRNLLTTLLGAGWEKSEEQIDLYSLRFDGPVLGKLSSETIQAVQAIEERASDEYRTLFPTTDLVRSNNQEIARLRRETRAELEKILTPQELEEYLLRFSNHARQLRENIRGFEATPDEFRNLFRATDSLEMELASLPADQAQRRAQIQETRDLQVRQTIGDERYALYKLNQDPEFTRARSLAEQNGLAAEKVLPLFEIAKASEEERRRIQNDASIPAEQKNLQIEQVKASEQNSIDRVLKNVPATP